MFSKSWCSNCDTIKKIFDENGLQDYKLIELDHMKEDGDKMQ